MLEGFGRSLDHAALLLHCSKRLIQFRQLGIILQDFGAFDGMLVTVGSFIQSENSSGDFTGPDGVMHALNQFSSFDKMVGQRFYSCGARLPIAARDRQDAVGPGKAIQLFQAFTDAHVQSPATDRVQLFI